MWLKPSVYLFCVCLVLVSLSELTFQNPPPTVTGMKKPLSIVATRHSLPPLEGRSGVASSSIYSPLAVVSASSLQLTSLSHTAPRLTGLGYSHMLPLPPNASALSELAHICGRSEVSLADGDQLILWLIQAPGCEVPRFCLPALPQSTTSLHSLSLQLTSLSPPA